MLQEELKNNWCNEEPEMVQCTLHPLQSPETLLETVDIGESNTKAEPARISGKTVSLLDARLHGDFNLWSGAAREAVAQNDPNYQNESMTGKKMRVDAVRANYIGMFESVHSHNNEGGVLVKAQNISHIHSDVESTPVAPTSTPTSEGYFAIHMYECVVRPDVELKQLIGAVHRVANSCRYRCTLIQRSHMVVLSNYSRTTTASSLHAVAASVGLDSNQLDLIRGNDELNQEDSNILTAEGASNEMDHSLFQEDSTAINSSQHENVRNRHHNNGVNGNTDSSSSTGGLKEWDMVDVQVCVSKELRQRVVLCLFLRKVNPAITATIGNSSNTSNSKPASMGLGGYVLSQLTNPNAFPIEKCPKTRKFIAGLKVR